MIKKKSEEKIKELLKAREKMRKRLGMVKGFFRQEKENEEAWPGHASTRYQVADSDWEVLLRNLSLIEKELEELGYEE